MNGELATEQELEQFELLAQQLLEGVTPQTQYEYGYQIDTGETILFRTIVSEGTEEPTFSARLLIHYGDYENPFFVIEGTAANSVERVGLDNSLSYMDIYTTAERIASGVKDLPEFDQQMLSHIQTTMLNCHAGESLGIDNTTMSKFSSLAAKAAEEIRFVDFVYAMVMATSRSGVRFREVSPFPGDYVVVREATVVLGPKTAALQYESESDFEELNIGATALDVRLVDAANGKVYYYHRDEDGERQLEVSSMDDDGEESGVFIIDDAEVNIQALQEELQEELGYYAPAQKDVKHMSKMLTQSWLYMNGIVPDIGASTTPNEDE